MDTRLTLKPLAVDVTRIGLFVDDVTVNVGFNKATLPVTATGLVKDAVTACGFTVMVPVTATGFAVEAVTVSAELPIVTFGRLVIEAVT